MYFTYFTYLLPKYFFILLAKTLFCQNAGGYFSFF